MSSGVWCLRPSTIPLRKFCTSGASSNPRQSAFCIHPRDFCAARKIRFPAPCLNQRAVLRIANKQNSANVAAREIRAHIEFTGISRRRDHFGYVRRASTHRRYSGCSTPANEPARARSVASCLRARSTQALARMSQIRSARSSAR